MRNSRKLAKAAIIGVGMAGMPAICGPAAQAAKAAHAAPTGHAAVQQVGGGAASTSPQTVGLSGKVIEFKDGHLELATTNGEVTFELAKGTYRYGFLQPGFHAYVAAYEQNGAWVATAIFADP